MIADTRETHCQVITLIDCMPQAKSSINANKNIVLYVWFYHVFNIPSSVALFGRSHFMYYIFTLIFNL